MEKAIAEALVIKLLENSTDQWGNTILSPLSRALAQYAETNKKTIEDLILSKIQTTDFVDTLATKISEIITKKGSDWYPNRTQEDIIDIVYKIVAEKLAEQKLEEMKKENLTTNSAHL